MSMEKSENLSRPYEGRAAYWEKHEPRVMGDLRNRAPLLEMMGNIQRHHVLEAGSGTGYFARMLEEKGAIITGVELSPDMIEKAAQEESAAPRDIAYARGNIAELPVEKESMDDITCVGVLIHLDEAAIRQFLAESRRVLKKGGHLYIGVNHPDLYRPESVHRRPYNYHPNSSGWGDKESWVKYTPLEKDKPYEVSQKFREDYYDKDDQLFSSEVWHHTTETYERLIGESGLVLEEAQSQKVAKEDLLVKSWGDDYGENAYWHLKLRKE